MTRYFTRFRLPAVFLLAAILLYAFTLSSWSIGRARNFNAGWYDLGIMTQTVWNVGHGHGFTFTNPEKGPGGLHGQMMLRSAIHSDYFLILLAPLSWFGSTMENLLVFQALILALGGWFVFRISQTVLNNDWLALFFGLVYLAYSPLHFANLFDFHSVTLATTFFLGAADAILRGRHWQFWMWAALALVTKEQVGISLGLLAGALYWRRGERRRAGWALIIPVAWALLMVLVAIPLSRPGQDGHFVVEKFYASGESSGADAVKALLNPSQAWQLIATQVHLNSLFQLLVPLGGLALLHPITYLMIPELLLYWLWDTPNPQTLLFHYHALFIPFLFIGTIFSWGWITRLAGKRWPGLSRWVGIALIGLVSLGTAVSVARMSVWPWSPLTRWPLIAWKEKLGPNIREGLRLIPDGAPTAFTQNLGAQLAERPVAQIVPNGVKDVRYIAILQRSFGPETKTDARRLAEKAMLEQLIPWLEVQPAYRVRYRASRFYVLERVGEPTAPEPEWPAGILGR